MSAEKLKKGDQVMVLTGRDRGKKSKIARVYSKTHRAIVEGVNIAKKHQKASAKYVHGGIIEKPIPLSLSNLVLICPNCGQPTRVGFKTVNENKTRLCKKCHQPIA